MDSSKRRSKRLRDKETPEEEEELSKKLRFRRISKSCFRNMINDHQNTEAELTSIIAARPDLLLSYKYISGCSITPLHAACSGRSYEFIELLVRHNPHLLKHKNWVSEGLPLHLLCQHHDKYRVKELLLILELMVDTYPNALRVLDICRATPLHLACRFSAPLPVIQYLIQCDPHVLLIQDGSDRTPLYLAGDYSTDLSTIQLLYTSCPEAARYRNKKATLLQAACHRRAPLEFIKYLAINVCPVDCLFHYKSYLYFCIEPGEHVCLAEVRKEAVLALIDVAFCIKQVLPEQVMKEIFQNVGGTNSILKLSSNQCSGLTRDESAHWRVNNRLIMSVLRCEKLKCLLGINDKTTGVYALLDSVIRMNRARRQHCIKDSNNKVDGMKMLLAANGLDALFFYLRENPALCK